VLIYFGYPQAHEDDAERAVRRKEIKLQIELITPLMHFRGYGAAETRSAALRARTLIEQAQERGEAPEDPLLLFSVLYSFWVANFNAFDGNIVPELAAQFLKLAEEQRTDAPLMLGHRLVGVSLTTIGKVSEARTHLDRVVALYDPVKHRQLAARFGQDIRVATLCYRSWVRWMLGYPEASLIDADMAIKEAREIGQGIPLTYALYFTSWARIHCGEYAIANEQLDELVSMANREKCFTVERRRADAMRLDPGPDRKAVGCDLHDHCGNSRVAIKRLHRICALVLFSSGEDIRRARAIR
jgi:hypothetical protein